MTPLISVTRSQYNPAQLTTYFAATSPDVCSDDVAGRLVVNRGHAGLRDDGAAGPLDVRGQALANASVINDSRFGDMDGADAGRVGFQFMETFRPDDFAFDAVGLAPLEDPLHRGQLALFEATMTFPQMSWATPSSWQNLIRASRPSRQLTALREPGL